MYRQVTLRIISDIAEINHDLREDAENGRKLNIKYPVEKGDRVKAIVIIENRFAKLRTYSVGPYEDGTKGFYLYGHEVEEVPCDLWDELI